MESSVLWFDILKSTPGYEKFSDEQLRRQIELESLMKTEGLMEHDRAVEKAKGNSLESTTSYGRALLRTTVKPFADAIAAEFEHISSGKPGLGNSALKPVLCLSPEAVAFMTLRNVINVISQDKNTLQSLALAIGSAIEDEIRYKHFEHNAKKRFSISYMRSKTRRSYQRKRNCLTGIMENIEKGVYDNIPHPELSWDKWPSQQRVSIGIRLINILVKNIGWVDVVNARRLACVIRL